MNDYFEFRIVKDGFGKFIVQGRGFQLDWEDTDFSASADIAAAERYIEREIARIRNIRNREARIPVDNRIFKV